MVNHGSVLRGIPNVSPAHRPLVLQDSVGGVPVLWHLHPGGSADRVIVIPVPVTDIIATLHKGEEFPHLSLEALARMAPSQARARLSAPRWQQHNRSQRL